jgi:hypothetical protein
VKKRTKTRLAGSKTIAALLMLVLLSVLIPTRGAEVARSNDYLRACRESAGAVAEVGHASVVEISKAVVYLTLPEKELCLPSPSILIYPHRGPPVLS